MEIVIRDIEYKEKCSLCKNDYRDQYDEIYGNIFHRYQMYIVQINKIKICQVCFYNLVSKTYSEHDAYGLYLQKIQERKAESPQKYTKTSISKEIRWQVWERDNFTCLKCQSRKHLAVDHIIPESKGGATELDNLQTLCKQCNMQKGTKTIDYREMYEA